MALDLAAPHLTTYHTPLETRPVPGLGQTVTYCLNQLDADVITDRRRRAELAAAEPPHLIGPSGSPVAAGDIYAAIVVRRHGLDSEAGLSLQVLLDGNDTHWVQRAGEGNQPGTWAWPGL